MRLLVVADDVTPEIRELIPECVDWFDGEPSNAAVRLIMRLAREERRGRTS